MPKIKTCYGKKKTGHCRYVFIAPHGAGDDLKTGSIASKLASKTGGFLVINNTFIKASNTRSLAHPELVEDFNRLHWGTKSLKYFWAKKKPEMKRFYQDIAEFCDLAKRFSPEQKAVAVYIHGMDDGQAFSIDLGCGARYFKCTTSLLGSKKHRVYEYNSGEITLRIRDLKNLCAVLRTGWFKDQPLKITVGQSHVGWSRQSAVQFHRHGPRDDYAVQMELSRKLRASDEAINYAVDLIARALEETYDKSKTF